METADYILEMQNIVKEFPGVKALNNVSFNVRLGEIHALCGENGAGKSTLMKILSGLYPYGTYSGNIKINSKLQKFQNIKDSQTSGVAIIYQELSLIPEMTVGENIFLGKEPAQFGVINWNNIYSKTQDLLNSLGLNVNPRTLVKYLGIGQQQLVEIAKALILDAKILVLDEPTSALTESEVKLLLNLMLQLKNKGVTCILISHKLNEVFTVADRITVLRDGKSISTHYAKDVNEARIIADMVGRELTELYPYLPRQFGDKVFELQNYSLTNPNIPGKYTLNNINLSVRKGEILGISGLMGAGRTELLMSLFGIYEGERSGTLSLNGIEKSFYTPAAAINSGMAIVTEDRKRLGLVLFESVVKNITLASLKYISQFGIINNAQEITAGNKYVKELRVKTPSLDAKVENLSGGNQQKVVIAKCLMTKPQVLFLDEPTRGIDVGAKAEIYNLINQLAAQGVAIIMVSSELPEVLGMSDRILVMSQGCITGEFLKGEASQEKIMTCATRVQAEQLQERI